ncbi:MAG: hypothetical protein PG981_000957 [Wolbachia endosymbiont of Ctenocephalides orientis wCori]|nr:MAG: hypothetical protein PG981_000957 [Wolbachia endosymbiont of Ctenocephalides orientis wCori]
MQNKQNNLEICKQKIKELKSTIENLQASYKELEQVIKEKGQDFLTKLKVKSDEVLRLSKDLMEHTVTFANKVEAHEIELEEKSTKISRLTTLNAQLEQDKKSAGNKDIEQQQTISEQNNRIKELEEQLRKSQEESNEKSAQIQSLTTDNKNISNKLEEAEQEAEAKGSDHKQATSEKDREIERCRIC